MPSRTTGETAGSDSSSDYTKSRPEGRLFVLQNFMKKLPRTAVITQLQQKVYAHYHATPRPLPWRLTFNPYEILVSEIMLQQTGVARVIPKYLEFLEHFPDVAALATAELHEVMTHWQGLGYNRRGIALKRAAEAIHTTHQGRVPVDPNILLRLPGIGPYTAAAVAVFSVGAPLVLIETNIRTVFIHEFFPLEREKITDAELAPLVEAAIDTTDPRSWYYALMDYGVMLKKTAVNPSRRSAHYSRQTPFAGSTRQMRSRILKMILAHSGHTVESLALEMELPLNVVTELIGTLEKDGLVTRQEEKLFV